MPSTSDLNQADAVSGTVSDRVPCISADDLMSGDGDHLVELVRSACLETGFFYIDLAEPQRDSIAAALSQMERFFALADDDERKQSVRQGDERDTGWVPRYTEPAYQPGTVSSLEAFDFDINNLGSSHDEDWPKLPDFRLDLTRCWHEYVDLGNAILVVIARAAGMQASFLQDRCNTHALSNMRLLSYAPETIQVDQNVGIAAHTDFECITLLYQTAPGLELLNVNSEWLDAPVKDGRIVVLLDDMLERWTNGVFRATGHRVRSTDEQRYSIVMFIAANDEMEIGPLQEFVTADSPARYLPISQEQHINNEVQRAKDNVAGT
jgi:isopenicillin N synthase-like dioxygenase